MVDSGVATKVVILAMEYRGFGRSDDAEMSEESFVPSMIWEDDWQDVFLQCGEVYFEVETFTSNVYTIHSGKLT